MIVTSVDEAKEAESGGAGRLELIRSLETGGLTPDMETVRQVTAAVRIPVRVMLRENPSMSILSEAELAHLAVRGAQLAAMPIDGLVLGWLHEGELDLPALATVLAAAPHAKATFHRAFEHVDDPFSAIRSLKDFPQIDRILANGGPGSWPERKRSLIAWSRTAAPEIRILAGGGLSQAMVSELLQDPEFLEVHVGRAARTPQEYCGRLDRERVALLLNSIHQTR